MNAAILSGVTLGGGVSQARIANDHDADLYACWCAIFESARTADVARDALPESSPRNDSAPQPAADSASLHGMQNAGAGPAAWAQVRHAGARAATLHAAEMNAARAPASAAPGESVAAIAVESSPPLDARVRSSACAPAPRRPARGAAAAPDAAAPDAAESVSVFVRGAAVSIVARAAIPEQEALQCAFEAARELTGERAALRRLTFNGRVLYEQAGEPAASRAGALVFAC